MGVGKIPKLPLEPEIGAVHLFEWKGDLAASGELNGDGARLTIGLRYHAFEVFEIGCWLLQNDFDLLAGEPLPVLPPDEFSLDTRRSDLQVIGTGDGVFPIEDRAQIFRDDFAIGVGDAGWFVNGDAKQLVAARSFQFHFNDLDALRLGHTLGGLFELRDGGIARGHTRFVPIKKWAFVPIKKWAFAHWVCSS